MLDRISARNKGSGQATAASDGREGEYRVRTGEGVMSACYVLLMIMRTLAIRLTILPLTLVSGPACPKAGS